MFAQRQFTALSLFTGAGGLDLGFEKAGFETRAAVEMDGACCAFLRANRAWPVIGKSIHQVPTPELLSEAGLRPGEADVLIGGPPCQPFSKSSYWVTGDSKRLADDRADTLSAYLRVLKEAQPRAFLLENVPGLAFRSKAEGLDRILDGVDQINSVTGTNYKPHWKVLDAADYGVPQHRERIFIIASRDGHDFQFPEPTHGDPDGGSHIEPFRTAWDAIGDISDAGKDASLAATGKWAGLLATIPEGENYLWHTPRGGGVPLFGWRTRYWNFLLKLAKDRPSWTIQAQPGSATGPFHWSGRKLSALELARLQTFPADLNFDCSRGQAQKLLGNAVPSLLGEVLARQIAIQFFGHSYDVDQPQLLPPLRDNMPGPEPVRPVGRPYLALIGDHADHPGTGLGNRALRRLASA